MNPPLVITTSWDDGHVLDFRVAELLSRHGLRGTFYVPFESQWGTMASEQIRELSRSFDIGGHTLHHHEVTSLPDAEARAEICECKLRLEELTGKLCKAFCFPNGRFRPEHVGYCASAGFKVFRTVEVASFDLPRAGRALLEMPTTVQAYPHRRRAYYRNFVKRFAVRGLRNYWAADTRHGWLRTLESLLNMANERGGVFHLWGHSWEIEEAAQWENLDCALGLLASFRSQAQYLTNSEVAELASKS